MQNHYNNEKGSLYKFAEDHGLNSWEFDLIKRIVRCRKKGQFREDLEKSKFLIELYLLEMGEPTPAPVTTYSYSVIHNTLGGFDFIIKDKGQEVYRPFGHYYTHLEATQAALKWIKEQEEASAEEPEMEEPKPAPVSKYSYSIESGYSGHTIVFVFVIKDKGKQVYESIVYDSELQAEQAAKEWIKEQEEGDLEDPEKEEEKTKYRYEEWLKSQRQA